MINILLTKKGLESKLKYLEPFIEFETYLMQKYDISYHLTKSLLNENVFNSDDINVISTNFYKYANDKGFNKADILRDNILKIINK